MAITAQAIRDIGNVDIDIVVSTDRVNEANTQIQLLHKNDDGFITIAIKQDNRWVQYHYSSTELEENIGKVLSIEGVNIYITPNSFYKPFRKIENVRKLNSLYIDLDYYTLDNFKGLTIDQVLWLLDNDYFKSDVPEPSFIVNSGRGLAIYWLIEPVPYKALPLWNAIQKHFLEKLKSIGADPKSIDAARVMRLAGSVNQKNGKLAELHVYNPNYLYSLRDIQKDYLPELTEYVDKPFKKKKGRKARVVNLYTLYSLHYARLRDLVKLQELRQGYCRIAEGTLKEDTQREFMCFLYRYWSCCFTKDKEKALEDTLSFNKGFVAPLSEKEVIKLTASAEKAYNKWLENSPTGIYKRGGYNYKNETLIDKLCITQEEMQSLETIIDEKEVKRRTNIRTNEHNKARRRNEEGLTKREQQKLDKINGIKALKEQGLNNTEIAKKLNISVRYVRQILNS